MMLANAWAHVPASKASVLGSAKEMGNVFLSAQQLTVVVWLVATNRHKKLNPSPQGRAASGASLR
jgi:hypothetical protein